MIKTIVIDDDPLHADSLVYMLRENFKYVEVVGECYTVPDAVEKINELKPQLVFLDIEMGSYTGFDLLEMTNDRDFEVIFTTCYQHYALQALKASALDYIEKPINKFCLAEAINRYKVKTGKERMVNLLSNFKIETEDHRIALYVKGGYSFFELKRIIRCESFNTYTDFYILDGNGKDEILKIDVSKGMGHFEDLLLNSGFFFRVHNRHLININHIRKYVKNDMGYLEMTGGSCMQVPVARARKDEFIQFLKSKGIII